MTKKTIISTTIYVLLLVWIVIAVFPPAWMVMTSFKDRTHVYDMPPQWFPTPNLKAYVDAFEFVDLARYLVNSLTIALLTTGICIGLGAPAAWGLSKFRFPGGNLLFWLIIGTRMVPPVALLTPFFEIFTKLKIIDNIFALIIPYTFFNLPLALWIIKNFFDGTPKELCDAARIDGCTHTKLFMRIALPINVPGIVLAAILVFLFSWNEFMFALVLTRKAAVTLPVGITDFFADGFIVWNTLSAAVVVSLIPAIVFVAFFQRHIVKGVTEGALKG